LLKLHAFLTSAATNRDNSLQAPNTSALCHEGRIYVTSG